MWLIAPSLALLLLGMAVLSENPSSVFGWLFLLGGIIWFIIPSEFFSRSEIRANARPSSSAKNRDSSDGKGNA
ncbi:MAG: hypothetical protein AAF270_10640 [Pseudomonadota bacterium]